MCIEEKFESYVKDLAIDYTQTSNIDYLLITTEDCEIFRYNGAIKYTYLFEFGSDYDENLTPQKILEIELINQNRSIGAIYKKINGKFELLVRKGF